MTLKSIFTINEWFQSNTAKTLAITFWGFFLSVFLLTAVTFPCLERGPNLLFEAPLICGDELTALMNVLKTGTADAALVLHAVELHQFAMIGTETLHQI